MEGSWKVGDLGRFSVEDPRRPRFEVLGSKPGRGVAVWYGGNPKPVFIPDDTFKAKCLNTWAIEVVPKMPKWVAPQALFQIDDERAAKVTQAVVKHGYSQQIQQVDVLNHDLRIRSIKLDYCSCFDETAKVLVMIPLKILPLFATRRVSRWDRLLGDDDPIGQEMDDIERLLRER
jgi:hypothetical protein